MTYKNFLQEFKKVAQHFVILAEDNEQKRTPGIIRWFGENNNIYCPLTAVCKNVLGVTHPSFRAEKAGEELRMSHDLIISIMTAADNEGTDKPHISYIRRNFEQLIKEA